MPEILSMQAIILAELIDNIAHVRRSRTGFECESEVKRNFVANHNL